jgi:hypothetical protein
MTWDRESLIASPDEIAAPIELHRHETAAADAR